MNGRRSRIALFKQTSRPRTSQRAELKDDDMPRLCFSITITVRATPFTSPAGKKEGSLTSPEVLREEFLPSLFLKFI